MFIRTLTSKYILSLIKYTGCVLILACLVAVQGVAQDPVDSPTTQTILNLSGADPINLGNEGKEIILTLINTENTEYNGIISSTWEFWENLRVNTSAQVIITTTNQNSSTLTLKPDNGIYSEFAGTVIVEGASSEEGNSHAEGKLDLATPNIFSTINVGTGYTPSIINNGTIILSKDQLLPNLEGNGKIQINNNTLTLANTTNTEYSGDISGSGQIIITHITNGSLGTTLTLSKDGGYDNFTGSLIIQEGYNQEVNPYSEGVLLTKANLFYKASSITNDGTLIIESDQVLPNLEGKGKIQITENVNSLTFNNTSESGTDYSGSITGEIIYHEQAPPETKAWSGEIIKTGPRKLTLSHSNQFTVVDCSITVDEGTLELTGAENIFNTPSVTVNSGAEIMVGGGEQVFKNLSGSGDIEIEANTDLISIYEKDCIISGKIIGGSDHTEFEKKGPRTLTLTGANEFSGYIKIDQGKIIFKGAAIGANEEIFGRENGYVEFYTEGTKFLYIPDKSKEIEVKSIEKTGDRDSILQIYEGATGCISAESFVISSGRLDYGGYFQNMPPSEGTFGIFDVKEGTTLSPGLTINTDKSVINTFGAITITNTSKLTIEENALLLFEFDVYNPDLYVEPDPYTYLDNEDFLKTFDRIVFQHENSTIIANDSTIDLDFPKGDVSQWAKEGNVYWIVDDHGFNNIPEGETRNYDNWLRDKYKDYFSLEGRYNGLYLIGKGAPEPPSHVVPEPSSWALMIGTMLTFLFLKKKRG